MSIKSCSPTASLLRSSRLFSLPAPLPRPSHESLTSASFTKFSDTATLPHPTHQALATPQSSLSRGDWGLKRPLPLRSTTKTSIPTFRIDAIDTLEHITEYESASDHTLTLQKWQEMDIPILAETERTEAVRKGRRTSVFERDIDNTAPPANESKAERWKYSGPWVAGKTQGEFEVYLKQVRRGKGEFREYLRQYISAQRTADRKRELKEERRWDDMNDSDKTPLAVDDGLLDDEIKRMRGDTLLGSKLPTLIQEFLDLPALPSSMPQKHASFSEQTARIILQKAETGPPKTHPSAGLSYLRSASYVPNHPLLGPQKERAPVQARILSPKALGQIQQHAKLGVGGVVADTTQDSTFNNERVPGLSYLDVDTEGGGKLWVSPHNATIDSKGRIKLHVKSADQEAVGVHIGWLFERPQTTADQLPRLAVQRPDASASQGTAASSGLGYGLTNRPGATQQAEKKADREYNSAVDVLRILEERQAQAAEGRDNGDETSKDT